MPGAISGLLTLASGPADNEMVSEFQSGILVRNARGIGTGATLFGLMSKLKTENAENTEYNWFERDPVTREVSVDSGGNSATVYGAGDTAIVIDDGSADGPLAVGALIQTGTILRTSSGELLRVKSIAETTVSGSESYSTITVERGFGGTTASGDGLADNDKLVIVTLGKGEAADPVSPVFEAPTTLTNYIQTFNSSVHLSNAFKGTKLRTDIQGPLRERRVQALERIARDIELAYFFGSKAISTSDITGSGRCYYTGGIVQSVNAISASPEQVLDGNGGSGVTIANFNTWLASILTLGSDAKIAFAGPKAYSCISSFANSASNGFRITGQENVYGLNITSINTPFGELNLAMHPLFKEISSYNTWMVVVDLALIVQKTMEALFLQPDIQTPGNDSYKEQFRAKLGLKLKFAEAFGYAYDLQKINAS